MFQGDECSGGWVSRGMGVPVTILAYSHIKCQLKSPWRTLGFLYNAGG